ncbi:MAG: hypothetical protein H7318_14960 [Oligoflexus sp.]|nr:hypothetical protein [Oligoflexus sp.]
MNLMMFTAFFSVISASFTGNLFAADAVTSILSIQEARIHDLDANAKELKS